ncbi:MAG TPA: STAS domain-containing protein [Acidobacteriaceae bacterium]|nr:STAS domain-containing protein [Acidobacteriaceae bacterium]
MPLTLSTRHCGSVYVVHCAGHIVHGEEEQALDATLDHAERTFSRIVLNLSDISRLDSMGLGLLVRHSMRVAKRGGAIHLAGSPPFVANLLDLTQLSRIIPNFADEDEAIRSFLGRASDEKPSGRGVRLLVFDPSADLCTFARTILSQHGFNVRTTCSFGDAKLLLRVERADYILVGPCSAQLPPDMVARELAALAPQASILKLDADFKSRDALEATETLLQMFDVTGASQRST